MKSFTIYTDGGCHNHGNKKGQHVKPTDPCAWAYLIIDDQTQTIIQTDTKADHGYTNNQMEIQAITEALKYIYRHDKDYQNEKFHLMSDSSYALRPLIEKSINQMAAIQFQGIPNGDLLAVQYYYYHQFDPDHLRFSWVHGHDKSIYNNQVHNMLTDEIKQQN